MIRITSLAVAVLAAGFAAPATAQRGATAMVSLYHAAPGEQVALLKWLADQDRVATAAGVPRSQLYVHSDGDSWDYLMIAPITTAAQDAAVEAAGARMGIDVGPKSSIEFRKHILSHSDTSARGPTTAADYLALLGVK